MWQNMGREIQLERREMMFPWISVGGKWLDGGGTVRGKSS
jgi:hypothetical protein